MMFSFFMGGRAQLSVTYSANTQEVDLVLSALTGYQIGQTDLTITVNAGVYLWSDDTTNPGLKIRGGAAGDRVTLVNNGYIMGCGGNGAWLVGTGPVATAGGPGLILNGLPLTVTGSGYIAGGGGGGGGYYGPPTAYGGAGGGGAGGGEGGRGGVSGSGGGYSGQGGAIGVMGTNGTIEGLVAPGGGGGRILPGVGASGVFAQSSVVRFAAGLGGEAGGSGGADGESSGAGAGGGGGGWGAAGANAAACNHLSGAYESTTSGAGGTYDNPGGLPSLSRPDFIATLLSPPNAVFGAAGGPAIKKIAPATVNYLGGSIFGSITF